MHALRVRDGEQQLISKVVESLVTAFPHLPEAHVRACVVEVHRGFDDAKVRTYLPILVTRRARSVLAGLEPATVPVPRSPDGADLVHHLGGRIAALGSAGPG
jgi:hypothetical protein